MKKVISIILAVAMFTFCFLALSGCYGNKKMVNGDTFKKKAEAAGFTVTDMMTEEYEEEYYDIYVAETEDIYIQYIYAKDDTLALYLFEDEEALLREYISNDATVDEVSAASYACLKIIEEDTSYLSCIRSVGTFVYAEANPQGSVALQLFIDDLGY